MHLTYKMAIDVLLINLIQCNTVSYIGYGYAIIASLSLFIIQISRDRIYDALEFIIDLVKKLSLLLQYK